MQQPKQNIHRRGLPRAGASDDADCGIGTDFQRQPRQGGAFSQRIAVQNFMQFQAILQAQRCRAVPGACPRPVLHDHFHIVAMNGVQCGSGRAQSG